MQEVEGENDRGRQQADCGEEVCREGSAIAKLTARQKQERRDVLDVEARYEL
jgi:hypothetical protein